MSISPFYKFKNIGSERLSMLPEFIHKLVAELNLNSSLFDSQVQYLFHYPQLMVNL